MPWYKKLADIIGQHKKFSSIQKIIGLFLILGIFASFSFYLLVGFIVYIFVTGTTILVCQYLVTSKHTFRFLLSIYVHFGACGYLYRHILSITTKLREIFSINEENLIEEEFKSDDGECFYDANETNVKNEEYATNIQLPYRQANKSWQSEVDKITDLIQKHFIHVWLKDFDPHINVITEFDQVMKDGTRSLANRLKSVDMNLIVKQICLYGRLHLRTLQISRDKYKTQPKRKLSSGRRDSGSTSSLNRKFASVEEAFEMITTYHIGLYGSDNEMNYLYSICEILLNQTFGDILQNCHGSNFLISEILTTNVLLPVLDMLSEPDFIYEKIILILSNEPLDLPVDEEDYFLDLDQPLTESNENSSNPSENEKIFPPLWPQNQSALLPDDDTHNTTQISTTIIADTHNITQISTSIKADEKFVHDIPISLLQPATSKSESDSGKPKTLLVKTSSSSSLSLSSSSSQQQSKKDDKLTHQKQGKPDFFISSDNDQPPETYLSSMEIIETKPAKFLDVSIIDYEIRNESRSSSQFVLYTIQYDANYWEEAEKIPFLRTMEAKRRHREFINLHSRLVDNSNYKKSLKTVKGPKRWQTLPFGNLNKRSIEERRKNLEAYLKSLIQKNDICNGPELKEFLAYDGDAHIAFVRKSPEISMPRIDRIIVKTVSGMFDKIIEIPSRVSFPSLPGIKKDVSKEDQREDCDKIEIEFEVDSKYGSQEETLEEFATTCDDQSIKIEEKEEKSLDSVPVMIDEEDISLAEAVVDIGVQTLQGQDNWVCRERVLAVTKHLIGVILDRWLKDQIAYLTSEEMCVKYLQLLRETVWPDGELFEGGRPVKTDRQKAATKEQARRCLTQFFPDTLKRLVGKEDFDHGINEIVESLQYKKLNRHLIYTLLDHLMHILYPDVRKKSTTA